MIKAMGPESMNVFVKLCSNINGKLFAVRSKANSFFLHVTIGMLFIVLCIVKLLGSHLHLVYIG